MNLKSKVYEKLDVYFTDDMSEKDKMRELNRRGKLSDPKVLGEIVFLLVEEIEALGLKRK